MSITRRALLGTLVGLPLGIKAAQASPNIGDITVTAISGPTISQQRIGDIGDAFLTVLRQALVFKDDSPECEFLPIDKAYLAGFLIHRPDFRLSIQAMVQKFIGTAARTVPLTKYRYAGVTIKNTGEKGLRVMMMVSNSKKRPHVPNVDYSKWVRTV